MLMSSALLRPPSLTDRRSLSAGRHIAPASVRVKESKRSQDLHFQIEVSIRDVGGVKSQRRDLCTQTEHQRRFAAFPTLESGARADEDKRPCQ